MKVIYPITLDCKKTNIQKTIQANTGEGNERQLVITLVSGNKEIELTDETVSVCGVKPDGTEFANTATINEDGKIEYTLTTQNVAAAGDVDCQVRVLTGNSLLYSAKFVIHVEENLTDEEAETSSNEWTELITALQEIQNITIKLYKDEGVPTTDPEDYPNVATGNFYFDETNEKLYYSKAVTLTTVTWERIATKSELDTALATKQDTLTAINGLGIWEEDEDLNIGIALESGQDGNLINFVWDDEEEQYLLTLHGNQVANDTNFKTTLGSYVYTETEVDNLLAAKQALIDSSHKLSADLLSDGTTNKPSVWNAKQDAISAGNGIDLTSNTVSAKLNSSSDNGLTVSSHGLLVSKSALGYDNTLRTYLVNTNASNPLASKEYVDNLMSGAVKRLVVESLPTQDIDTNTIYMILKSVPSTNNIYDEYMYINNAWELIGSTEVDLSNYYTKTESSNRFASKSNTYTKQEVDYAVIEKAFRNLSSAIYTMGTSESNAVALNVANYNTLKITNASLSSTLVKYKIDNGTEQTISGLPLTIDVSSASKFYCWNTSLFAGEYITYDLTNDDFDYATQTDLANKQDKLTVGDGIDITNNEISTKIVSSGNILKFSGGELVVLGSDIVNDSSFKNAMPYDTTIRQALTTGSNSPLQPKLTAGTNITIDSNNVISASGGGSYSGGDGIDITNDTISVDLKSGSKLQFDNGELDVDLSSKEDKTDITTDTTSTTVSLTLADNHEYRYTQDLTSLTLTMPSGDFISSIVFASGSTPTSMTYDSSIKWSGDDVTNGQFVPSADKDYDLYFYYNGLNVNGIVRGVS